MEAGDIFRLIYFVVIVFIFFGSIIRNIMKGLSGAGNQTPQASKSTQSDEDLETFWQELINQEKQQEATNQNLEQLAPELSVNKDVQKARERKRRERRKILSRIKARHQEEIQALQDASEASNFATSSNTSFTRLLNNRESLREAFIMSEIFKRKY